MRIFIKAIGINLKVYLAYPKGFLINCAIHPFIMLLNIYLFTAIYDYNGTAEIKGYSLTQMIWYFNAMQMIMIFIWNFTDRRMSGYILSGDLGVLLLRPFPVYRYELANAIALRIAGVLFEFFPDFLIFSLLYMPTFMSIPSFMMFLTTVIGSFVLYFLLNYLIGMSAILTQDNRGLSRITSTLTAILGGSMIPLDFFPAWLQRICDFLPFKYMFYMPIQFFLNREEIQGVDPWLHTLAIQLLWAVLFYVTAKISWRFLLKRIAVVGG